MHPLLFAIDGEVALEVLGAIALMSLLIERTQLGAIAKGRRWRDMK